MKTLGAIAELIWWAVRLALTLAVAFLLVRALVDFFPVLATPPRIAAGLRYVDPPLVALLERFGIPWSREVRQYGLPAAAISLLLLRWLLDELIVRLVRGKPMPKQAPPAGAPVPALDVTAARPALQSAVTGTAFQPAFRPPATAAATMTGTLVEAAFNPATPAPTPRIGRYDILEELGRGAMGVVYKGLDPTIGRTVAIKTISSISAGPEMDQYRERFLVEARSAGRLNHPGIVSVYDVADDDLGRPALVLEFVEGSPFDKLVVEKPMSLMQMLDILAQIARALAHAHGHGIIHRDVKPSNIMVTAEGVAKLSDFGIAKMDGTGLTMAGQVLGTPAFMSPEQCTGSPLDSRSDIFSLGAVIYAVATGKRPFTGDTFTSVAYNVVHEMPIPPTRVNPDLPAELDRIIWRCMAKAPADRYTSAAETAADLDRLRVAGLGAA